MRILARIGVLIGLLIASSPALACDPCGCGLPGNGIEIAAPGVGSLRQAQPGSWLLTTGLGLRDITGSFNDRGAWSPRPAASRLWTWQAQSSLTWFPTAEWTVGLQVPVAFNDLDRAQWGGQGSIRPVDTQDLEEMGQASTSPRQMGGGLADIDFQASWLATPGDETWPAMAWWGNLTCPTGRGSGSAADQTGTGAFQAQGGLSLWQRWESLELSGSLGASLPVGVPAGLQNAAFFLGRSVLGLLQANLEVSDTWRLGVGALGFRSMIDSQEIAPSAASMGKLKLIGSCEWRPVPGWTLRATYGMDPGLTPGVNAMTDQTFTFLTSRLL